MSIRKDGVAALAAITIVVASLTATARRVRVGSVMVAAFTEAGSAVGALGSEQVWQLA
jgi:hypothetical protein